MLKPLPALLVCLLFLFSHANTASVLGSKRLTLLLRHLLLPDPALHRAKRYLRLVGEFGICCAIEKRAADIVTLVLIQLFDTAMYAFATLRIYQ